MSSGKREHPGGAVFIDGRRHCQNRRGFRRFGHALATIYGPPLDTSEIVHHLFPFPKWPLSPLCGSSSRNNVMSNLLEIVCGKPDNITRGGQNCAASPLAHLSSCQAAISQHSVPSQHTGRWSFTDRFCLQLLQRLILPLLSLFEFMLTINAHSTVRRES